MLGPMRMPSQQPDADKVGRSANKAIAEDVRRYQLWLASIGATVPTVNAGAKLFVKQIGSNDALWPSVTGKGEDPSQRPAVLRVQDFPQ